MTIELFDCRFCPGVLSRVPWEQEVHFREVKPAVAQSFILDRSAITELRSPP